MENNQNNNVFVPINNEDLDNCRFCLENDNEKDLFKPCLCNSKVHKSCLGQWRLLHTPHEDNFLKCEICNFEYIIKDNNKN